MSRRRAPQTVVLTGGPGASPGSYEYILSSSPAKGLRAFIAGRTLTRHGFVPDGLPQRSMSHDIGGEAPPVELRVFDDGVTVGERTFTWEEFAAVAGAAYLIYGEIL